MPYSVAAYLKLAVKLLLEYVSGQTGMQDLPDKMYIAVQRSCTPAVTYVMFKLLLACVSGQTGM